MRLVLTILFLIFSFSVFGQTEITHKQIEGRKGFNERQNINIISIPLSSLKTELSLSLAWSDSILHKTSYFADSLNAVAAINAGFFHVANGGSISYLENGNERVSRRSWRGEPDDNKQTNLNGAIILDRNNNVVIEKAAKARHYLNSPLEKWVLVTGPLLITNGIQEKLQSGSFLDNLHPRTCVGITNEELLLVTIDGRTSKAKGMSLHDVQKFLLKLNCIHAINLDGGGSTTMWLNQGDHQGVVNCPSDNGKFDPGGERKVANALLLIKN